MGQMMATLIPIGVMVVGIVLTCIAIRYGTSRDTSRRRRSPLVRDMLRPPGHSSQKRIDELSDQIDENLVLLLFAPILAFTLHISISYFDGQPETLLRAVGSVLLAVAFSAFFLWRLIPKIKKRRQFQLGLEGELATGEELNQLMLKGCRVFHDVRIPYGNIDHVVVSPSGVFCVETKMHGKPKGSGDEVVLRVDYQRNKLCFPDCEIDLPRKQLETNERELAKFLSSAVGEPIEVEAILVYPGWHITRDKKEWVRPLVINPTSPHKFFLQNRVVLTPKTIQQIAHQLDQRCRDVAPSNQENKDWDSQPVGSL